MSGCCLQLTNFGLKLLASHVDFHVLGNKSSVVLVHLLQSFAISLLRQLTLSIDAVTLSLQLSNFLL